MKPTKRSKTDEAIIKRVVDLALELFLIGVIDVAQDECREDGVKISKKELIAMIKSRI